MKSLIILLPALLVLSTLYGNQSYVMGNEYIWSVATQSGDTDLILKQLQAGLDISTRDPNNGNTALINAIESGNIDAVKLIVEAGADINEIVCTPRNEKKCALLSAFFRPEILEFLIESGADIHIRLNQKRTPLHYASESVDNFEALRILLKFGADPNALDLYGRSPLHSGIRTNKIAFILLDQGADFHIIDHEGWKPLHIAYLCGEMGVLRALLKRGASLREFTPQGGNALYHALSRFELIKFLIEEHKMDMNENSRWHNGQTGAPTFFMCAVLSQQRLEDNFEILDYLVANGADFNTKVFYHNGQRISVLFDSVLAYAVHMKVPHYVIDWMIENGAT